MDLYSKLSNCMDELTSTFTSRMAQYEEDLRNASSEPSTHKTIASLSREFTEFKGLMWKTLSTLKAQMELLVIGLDRHEMASRSKILLLHGLPEDKNQNLHSGILQCITQKLKVTSVLPNDITACYRLGTNMSRSRPVLVRFGSRMLRGEVWRNKANLKGSGLTLSEFLTKPRHDVFIEARKHFGIKQSWTSEGKIIVQVSDNSKHKIETAAELRQLITRFPIADYSGVPTKVGVDKRPRKPVK